MTSLSLLAGRTVDISSRLPLSSAEFFCSKYTLGNKNRAHTSLDPDPDPVRRSSVQTEKAIISHEQTTKFTECRQRVTQMPLPRDIV